MRWEWWGVGVGGRCAGAGAGAEAIGGGLCDEAGVRNKRPVGRARGQVVISALYLEEQRRVERPAVPDQVPLNVEPRYRSRGAEACCVEMSP